MVDIEIIEKYFELDGIQYQKLKELGPLYKNWNQNINVISRKDIDNLYIHHVLHSLSIAKFLNFMPGSKVLDLGTGGGFPGVPLSILFPKVDFTLIDGTSKKLKVIEAVKSELALDNLKTVHTRAEDYHGKFDFVVTRAVARSEKLFNWSRRFFKTKHQHSIPNGIIALKGGLLKEELDELGKGVFYESTPLSNFFEEPFFKEKHIVYIQA